MRLLDGKTALITGAGDGIGFAIAREFAAQGAQIVLVSRNQHKLLERETQLKQYAVNTYSIAADLSLDRAIAEIKARLCKHDITIDILVNNAGIARFVPFAETDPTLLDHHVNLNVRAPYFLTQTLLDDLVSTQGNVINISSYFSQRMLPDRPSTAYSLTKGAIDSLTKSLAFELGPRGVRVNAIAPGTVNTALVQHNRQQLSPEARARFQAMIQSIYPLQTIGEPEDIAQMAVFLASDSAKWITGAIMPVDGGLTTN